MAEEKTKKPKINLKDRLGKSAGGAPVPAGAPAPAGDGAPVAAKTPSIRPSTPAPAPAGGGIAPPPGIAPPGLGLAVNPFAPKPVAQPKAPPPSAEQQTIKIDVGEEIHAERKKSTKRSVVFGILGVVLGLVLGNIIGGLRERKARSDQAQQGSGDLEKIVVDATTRIGELEPMLDDIESGLKKKKYPTEVITSLSSFAVPFSAADLENKNVGNMPPAVQKQVFDFLGKAVDLEEKKNELKGILGNLQKPMETAWAEEQKPVFKLGVIFSARGENKTLAEMVQIKEPWAVGDAWPKEPMIVAQVFKEGKRVPEDKKATRWEKDALTGTSPIVIPIEPSTVAGFTDERNERQLRIAVQEVRQILKGNSAPGSEATGILDDGKKLGEALSSFHLRNK